MVDQAATEPFVPSLEDARVSREAVVFMAAGEHEQVRRDGFAVVAPRREGARDSDELVVPLYQHFMIGVRFQRDDRAVLVVLDGNYCHRHALHADDEIAARALEHLERVSRSEPPPVEQHRPALGKRLVTQRCPGCDERFLCFCECGCHRVECHKCGHVAQDEHGQPA